MLGRLLSHAFTSPDGSSSPDGGRFSRASSPNFVSIGDGANDDEIHPTFPVSFLDEADTRNLLYGQSFTPAGILSLDVLKDIRVVVICDSSCVGGFIYDSAREVTASGSVNTNNSVSGGKTSITPHRGSLDHRTNSPSLVASTLSSVSALTRSFSSTALSSAAAINNLSGLGIGLGQTDSTTANPDGVTSGKGLGDSSPSNKPLARPNTIASPQISSGRVSAPNSPHRRKSSGNNLPTIAPDVAPILQLALLKDLVFGYSAMKFQGQLTKIHPLPRSKGSSSKKQPWIVSRIFKIAVDDPSLNRTDPVNRQSTTMRVDSAPKQFLTSTGSTISNASVDTNNTDLTVDDADNENDSATDGLPGWQPKSNSTVPPLPPHTKDVRCAICISFNLPPESEDAITNHWTELSYALADLQATIYRKLERQLPQVVLDSRRKKHTPIMSGGHGSGLNHDSRFSGGRVLYSIDGDLEIQNAVDFFKSRFSTALRIPRVLCGQDNWSDLYSEMCIAAKKWEGTSDGGFLGAMICCYIDFNKDLLGGLIHEDDDIPKRTIILANNRIVSRKLIFILSSLIRSRTSERIRKRISLANSLNDSFVKTHTQRSSSVSTTYSVGTNSPRTRTSAKFSFVDGGWEVSQPASMIEPVGTVAIPHVVRPSFSSSSLAHSVGYGSTSDALSSSINGRNSRNSGGFFSNLWNSDNSYPETPGTPYDDYYFHEQLANADRDMASSFQSKNFTIGDTTNGTVTPSLIRPSMSRCHSSERSATTLNTINHRLYHRQHTGESNISANNPHTSLHQRTLLQNASDNDLTNLSYLPTAPPYRLVHDEENQIVIDVSESATPDQPYEDLRPIVLPRVAGHVSNFHPDFILQACPITRDLEDQISRTMLRDGDVNSVSIAARNSISSVPSKRQALSKSLIINLRTREISTYTLVASTDETSNMTQKLVRKVVFANHKPSPGFSTAFANISKQIADIVEGEEGTIHSPNRGAYFTSLVKAFEGCFGLL
ncbi:hypothetical protein AWJ20_4806 [Sugiyamaella lignohabitans]|uniref:Folliculin n=1 Tax=Sugiyamaella lignohabitans TaxID=796027 RepID=A0A167EB35_9ASCO|nr:uncharacterized protein AWJ20_4806 [Sugiyamaella lignohabitans]ANB13855.1 hypothetical protein AWJ20_4806 [Sugiyamaella lignohabitans]